MSEADRIFDAANAWSARVQRDAEIRELRAGITRAETQCGSCMKWMTPSCPRERHDNRTGQWKGPSAQSVKCDQFKMGVGYVKSLEAARAKLAAMEQRQ